ncbi:CMRF35-like molecule 1 [Tachysurus fulvidraco]|uniref:CMRF35-like molecule 1 n=1 Tax=Tachysurus fulvidraco TaxID=1234273 RepID=UPI001FEEE41E|nr:CMRF35-like molecule 1 [Tachysurus fulvidraco]
MCWLFVFILLISYVGRQSSMKFSLQTESTVTIPCGYDRAYIHHKKYWCSGSLSFQSCSIQAYANNTKGKVTVTDNPAESFFTVTLDHLQTKDTRWYWCGVEIDRGSDVSEALQITVKSDPDLSVNETRVRGVKGGSVTVQCLYSAAYQNTQKQWCRFKDGQCYTMRTETSQNSAVYISDDGRRSFSVRMSGLKKSDAGFYWCRAGDLQVPVHIAVNNLTVSPTVTNNTDSDNNQQNSTYQTLRLWLMVALGLGLLLILVIAVTYMMRKMCKKEIQTRTRMKSNDSAAHTPPLVLDREGDVTYSSVFNATKKQKTHTLIVKEDEVTYDNVDTSTVKDDDVTYGNVNYRSIRADKVIYSTVIHE